MLQGLDYWIWAMAHRKELAEHLNRTLGVALPATPPVMLDFVVAEKAGEIVSPYTAAQLEVLDGSIPWQVYRFDGWDHDNASISSFGRRRVPPKPTSVAWPRFAVRLESDLVTRADTALHRRVFFAESGAGVFDAAKPGLEALRQRVVAHRYADHVRSSQAFALNLFAGLPEPVLGSLWQLIDPTVTTSDGIEFEYIDPHDTLGELQPTRPHQTQVDVLLRGRRPDGTRHIALIEVKLTETAFGTCSGFDSDRNDTHATCCQSGPWGEDPESCFQLRSLRPQPRPTKDTLQAEPAAILQCPTNSTKSTARSALSPARTTASSPSSMPPQTPSSTLSKSPTRPATSSTPRPHGW